MRNLGFNGMNDEEFRREFMKFLTTYQSGLEDFMRQNYNDRHYTPKPFFNIEPFDNDSLKDLLKAISRDSLNIERGNDENGEWEKRSWQSPDGSSLFNSYIKNSYHNPFGGKGHSNTFRESTEDMDTLKLLENKLKEAVVYEKYESAAKIRDLINNLKEDKKKEKKK